MTQGSLAEACGVKQATISRIENGENNPSFELMEKMADVLGVTSVELLGLPEFEQMVLEKFRAANPKRRAALLALLETD